MTTTDQRSRPTALESVRDFGKHAQLCRRVRGLTQEELAERSGLSADTIRRLEKSSFSPSLDTLCKMCDGLQISLSTLFEGLEVGERNVGREFTDWLAFLTIEEEQALYHLLSLLLARLQSARSADSPPSLGDN